jgi:hypothetical protein
MYTCTTVRELDNMYVLGCEEIGEKKGACWRGGGLVFFCLQTLLGLIYTVCWSCCHVQTLTKDNEIWEMKSSLTDHNDSVNRSRGEDQSSLKHSPVDARGGRWRRGPCRRGTPVLDVIKSRHNMHLLSRWWFWFIHGRDTKLPPALLALGWGIHMNIMPR